MSFLRSALTFSPPFGIRFGYRSLSGVSLWLQADARGWEERSGATPLPATPTQTQRQPNRQTNRRPLALQCAWPVQATDRNGTHRCAATWVASQTITHALSAASIPHHRNATHRSVPLSRCRRRMSAAPLVWPRRSNTPVHPSSHCNRDWHSSILSQRTTDRCSRDCSSWRRRRDTR